MALFNPADVPPPAPVGPPDGRQQQVVRRLPRPVLLVLVLAMLFLPFLTVSCSSPVGGGMHIDFSGWDAALGTEPSVRGLEGFGDPGASGGTETDPAENATDTSDDTREQQAYALVQLLSGWSFVGIVLLSAAVLLFLRTSVMRSIAGLIGSAAAAAALFVNHVALRAYVNSGLEDAAARQEAAPESEFLPDMEISEFISVNTRWGLVLALLYLGGFMAANALLLAYRIRSRPSGPPPYAPVPPAAFPQPPVSG